MLKEILQVENRREEDKTGWEVKRPIKRQTISKMSMGTYISIITLNVNVLIAPTRKHRLTEWI